MVDEILHYNITAHFLMQNVKYSILFSKIKVLI